MNVPGLRMVFRLSEVSSTLELTERRRGTGARREGVTGVEATDVSSSLSLSMIIPRGERTRSVSSAPG